MESVIIIILFIVLAGVKIYKVINGRYPDASAHKDDENTEEFTIQEILGELERKQKGSSTTVPTPSPTARPETHNKSLSRSKATDGTTSRNATAKTDKTEPEFDLRKAVIYSEILTPKFKDEEL